jgi:DNA-binding NtrC family response regulator
MHLPAKKVSREAEEALLRYSWPGNIRELSNVLERALGLSEEDMLNLMDLPEYIRKETLSQDAPSFEIPAEGFLLEDEIAKIEKEFLCKALEMSRNSPQKTAQLLGLNIRALRYRLDKYGLSTEQ